MMTKTTTTYRISNRESGLVLGEYQAESPEAALDTMARDAGYEDRHEATVVSEGVEAYRLCDADTTEPLDDLRLTDVFVLDSLRAADHDGGRGIILLDGRRVYVEGPGSDLDVEEVEED